MAPLTNITITVPSGSRQYGSQLCSPPHWTDILVFYLSNYVVHVATIQLYPGESTYDSSTALLLALFFPTSGVVRGLSRIVRFAAVAKGSLTKAARAGALCMVVRDHKWEVRPGDRLDNVVYKEWTAEDKTISSDRVEKKPCASWTSYVRTTLCKFIFKSDVADHPVEEHSVQAHGEADTSTDRLARSSIMSSSQGPLQAKEPRYEPLDHALGPSSTCYNIHRHVLDSTKVFMAPWQREGSTRWPYLETSVHMDLGITRKVAGRTTLPPGYMLAFVPRDAVVKHLGSSTADSDSDSLSISSSSGDTKDAEIKGDTIVASYSAVTGIAAVAQLLFGLSAVWATTGPQIDRYGYAAFGLTVIPYTVMSLVNLIATIATPAYSDVYLVHSEIMQEAKSRGAVFSSVVGRLLPDRRPATFTMQDGLVISADQNGTVLWENDKGSAKQLCSMSAGTTGTGQTAPHRGRDTVGTARSIPCFLRTKIPSTADEIIARSPDTKSRSCIGTTSQGAEHKSQVSSAEFNAALYVPSHPQFQRKQRWYCRSNDEVLRPKEILQRSDTARSVMVWACILLASTPLLPIGLLSKFNKAQSLLGERVITMLWLAFGIQWGYYLSVNSFLVKMKREPGSICFDDPKARNFQLKYSIPVGTVLLCAPAIAGLVEVGLMYSKFGSCVKVY